MKPLSDSPKIIYLHPEVRDTILKKYPEIFGLCSESVNPDTVMIVDPTMSEVRVERDDEHALGQMRMHVPAFHLVLNSLRKFVDKYKEGRYSGSQAVRAAAMEMVEDISQGYIKEGRSNEHSQERQNH